MIMRSHEEPEVFRYITPFYAASESKSTFHRKEYIFIGIRSC